MELIKSASYRGFSVRSILSFVAAVIMTALLATVIGTATPAHAADWSGESILHDGHQYFKVGEAKAGESHNLPIGSNYYLYIETIDQTNPPTRKAHVIYFAPGLSPPTETSASYVTYDYSGNLSYSNPSATQTISLTPQGQGDATSTSCAIQGVGWIVCSVSVFLAQGMDFVFNALSGFMNVQPISNNTENTMYVAWNVMRSIANVAFIIVFLIIIYSQVTSMGVGNYGLKKLIPRLIIAAILVNLSYLICAIAIDISNILGYALQDMFIQIRNQLFNVTNDTWGAEMMSWESLVGFVLSGGTASLAVGIGAVTAIAATGGTIAGAIFLLLPALLGLILAVLVVLLILAARQAIITILLIIAPLAFVAYLLPNTEKWFEKWRSLFMTMLIFFPAFSLVFGGSQLAGAVIIQNATSINILILGMIVQVAPLVITPLLLKLSGSLLGRIAGLVNNPNKGIMDQTRKWADSRREEHRQRGIGGTKLNGEAGARMGFMRRASRSLNNVNRRVADRTKSNTQFADNNYHSSDAYKSIHENMADAELEKDYVHNNNAAHIEVLKTRPGSTLYERAMNAQASKEILEQRQNQTNTHFNSQRVRPGSILNNSTVDLEVSKARLESSENAKSTYLDQQRTITGSALNATVGDLEASKIRVESMKNNYTTMVEGMKLDPTSALYRVAQNAQMNKDKLETAQNAVQALFDAQRATDGTGLNLTNIALDKSKMSASRAKDEASAYMNALKAAVGTDVHLEMIRAEQAKQTLQVTESQVTRVVEEYKSGKIEKTLLTTDEQTVMERMATDTDQLAAEKQGIQSAQSVQQQNFAKILSTDPVKGSPADYARAEELLAVAGSVDAENGKQRALATAIAQQSGARKSTLENIKSIIGFKNLTSEKIRQLAEGNDTEGIEATHDAMTAALQMTFSGKDTNQIEQALEKIDFSFPGASEEEREERRVAAAEALETNAAKPPYMTAGAISMWKQGFRFDSDPNETDPAKKKPFTGAYGESGVNDMIVSAIMKGKIDSGKLQVAGNDYATAMLRAVQSEEGKKISGEKKDKLIRQIAITLDPSRESSERLGDSSETLEKILTEVSGGQKLQDILRDIKS